MKTAAYVILISVLCEVSCSCRKEPPEPVPKLETVDPESLSVKELTMRAEAGDKYSQIRLGVRYAFGDSIEANYREAFYWLLTGRALGAIDVDDVMTATAEHLTSEEIMEEGTRAMEEINNHERYDIAEKDEAYVYIISHMFPLARKRSDEEFWKEHPFEIQTPE